MKIAHLTFFTYFCAAIVSHPIFAQPADPNPTASEMFANVNTYVADRVRELRSEGRSINRDRVESIERERVNLAKRYAAELVRRGNSDPEDSYYLGRLYLISGDDQKALDALNKFLDSSGPAVEGETIQLARAQVVVLASKRKDMAMAVSVFESWKNSSPISNAQRSVMKDHIALGFYRAKDYDKAINYGENAFEVLKDTESRTLAEKKAKEKVYMNLVEVLAMSYRRNKDRDRALDILAEARARSFTLPSANLYRRVMSFVSGSGFSEKRLMQKLESYPVADPAPEIEVDDWIGQEPATLDSLRGNVILIDFWATWCGPCIATFPRLREWHRKYSESGFMIIGVTQLWGTANQRRVTPEEEMEFLNEFKAKHKLPYGFAVTPKNEYESKYGIEAYPTVVLLDRQGVVRYIGIGAGKEEISNLEDMIKKLLKE